MLIGLLEDDQAQADFVTRCVEKQGHKIVHATLAKHFFSSVFTEPLDVIILDWEIPDKTGLEVLKKIRSEKDQNIPILFTTQRDDEADIVAALQAGADDYLIKPLREAELLARLTAVARRAGVKQQGLKIGELELDLEEECIRIKGEKAKLTRKDFLVAKCMMQNFGKLLSREFLLKEVWGLDSSLDTRTVDVHVSRVRRSLGISPETGYCIRTVHQHGYRYEKID